jgi:hypothetical protein
MISTLNVSAPETASGRYFCRKILASDLLLDSPMKSFNAILLVFVDCTVYFTVPYKAWRQRRVTSAALQAVAMAGFVFLGVPFVDWRDRGGDVENFFECPAELSGEEEGGCGLDCGDVVVEMLGE